MDTSTGDTAAQDTADTDTGDVPDETGEPDTDSGEPVEGPPAYALDEAAGAKLLGEAAYDAMSEGARISVAGSTDVDGDGSADLLVGMPGSDSGAYLGGATYLIRGPISGTQSLAGADARILGTVAAGYAGHDVAFAGDVNGDGVEDVVVGAPYFGGSDMAGEAYVLFGPLSGDMDVADGGVTLVGELVDDGWHSLDVSWTGRSVAGAGDVDGDGVDDLLVGAPYYDLGRGAAYVVHGALVGDVELASAGTRILGEDGDELGYTVRRLGDLDGDGLADFAVGTQDADGTGFYLFHGPALGVSSPSDADASFRNTDGSGSGTLLCPAGDTDGDGLTDIWVNDIWDDTVASNAGGVLLLPGPLEGALDESAAVAAIHGMAEEEHAGSPAPLGDVDADGRSDLAVGAGYGGPGSVYVMLAPFTGTRTVAEAIARFEGDGDDNARSPVAGGDIDGDGLGDLLIAGPGDDDGGTDAGAVWVVYASSLF